MPGLAVVGECPFCRCRTAQIVRRTGEQLLAWCQTCFHPRLITAEEAAAIAVTSTSTAAAAGHSVPGGGRVPSGE